MTNSYNGWPASKDPKAIGVDPNWEPIPGHRLPGGIKAGDVETVMTYFARQLHARVEPIDRDAVKDDWGYVYKHSANSPKLISCHASATAFDWNSTRHPNGKRGTFTAAQVAEIRKIQAETRGVVRWLGDATGTPDEMHFEIRGTPQDVATAAAHLPTNVAPTTTGDTDMHLIQITDGPDNGKVILINGDCRRYIDTGVELDQFVGLLGAPKPLGNAAWQNIIELTALDAPGLRSIPPAQYQALVADVTEKVLAGVLQDDGPLHQWIETVGNQVRHVQAEADYIVAQSGWPPFPQ